MNKKIKWLLFLIILGVSLCGCKKECEHSFSVATCNEAAVCSKCGETDGDALGHDWLDATCVSPKKCKLCGQTEGSTKEHSYSSSTCTLPATCSVCGVTNGTAAGHRWNDATYDAPKTCAICGATEGSPLVKLNIKMSREYLTVGAIAYVSIDNYDPEYFNTSCSEEGIITIDEWGTIKALKEGNVTITFTYMYDTKITGTLEVEVISQMPACYLLYDKMIVGDTSPIFFKNLDALDADSINDFDVTFENGILSFEDGRVVAESVGEENVIITLKKDNRITTTCSVKVINPQSSIAIHGRDETGKAMAGEQIQMTLESNVSNIDFVWCTSDEDIAVIDDYGTLTIKKEGYVTVSAYDSNNVADKNYRANYNLYIEGEIEVDYISRFIHTALRENGTKEDGTNNQKYGEWYPNPRQPWCAMFVSWCWHHAGLSTDLLLKYQGCYAGMKWCTEQGIMHFVQDYTFGEELNGASSTQYGVDYQPQTGDIVFFLSAGMGHTGIVIYSDDTYLYTIEGNTSDMVAIKRWTLNDARITGYATPKYPEYSGTREDFSWIKEKKDDGTYWWSNVSAQQKVD